MTVMRPPVADAKLADVQLPFVTVTLPGAGGGHPAGTVMRAWELALKSLPFVAVKVNVKLFPVLPAATVVGLTTMVPSPLEALPSVKIICA